MSSSAVSRAERLAPRGPSLKALAEGFSYKSIRRLQARYRTLYAIVGLAMVVALCAPGHPRRERNSRVLKPAVATSFHLAAKPGE